MADEEVRPARLEDIDGIEAIDRSLDRAPDDRNRVRLAIKEGRVAVAVTEGVVIGYVRTGWLWEKLALCILARVRPESQRSGVGRRLYGLTEDLLRRAGHEYWLSSAEAGNDVSLLFHEALGFRRIGALSELGQHVDEVFLRKDIGRANF